MYNIDILKRELSEQAKLIKNWDDACNMASSDSNPLLERAIYSAMDNVECVQDEEGISGTEAFQKTFQGTVQGCIDDAEGMYGNEFVNKCLLECIQK